MGGVQHSTYLLTNKLKTSENVVMNILLPGEGSFSQLCKESNIPYSFYKSSSYKSTSISFFNDRFRIPNPITILWNIIAVLFNSFSQKKYINEDKPDLIVTKGLINHISGGIAGIQLKIPVIWHLQDLISQRIFGLFYKVFNFLTNHIPDYIICDGKAIQSMLNANSLEKSSVVLSGLVTEEIKKEYKVGLKIRRELKIPQEAYVIGNVSRICPWKGQEILLKAFIEYMKEETNSYLLLVGSPLFSKNNYYKKLQKIIEENHLQNKVIMPGYRTDLKAIFSAMDLFLYPSVEKDTSPLSLLSAISAGLPVAISNIGSLEDISNLCPALDVFPVKSTSAITQTMKKYEDVVLRTKNGRKNRESAKIFFDISVHSEKMLSIFKKLVDLP